MTPRAVLADYRDTYREAMAALPNLRLDDAALAARLGGVAALADGGRLENYSRLTFATPEIRTYLATIDGELAKGGLDQGQSARVRGSVNDLLLANAVIPTRESGVRDVTTLGVSTLHNRRAIEVLSRADLARVLNGVRTDLMNDRDPCGPGGVLGRVDYREDESLAQRYTRLSLLNLRDHAQRNLTADKGFTDLLASRILPDALFAASGHNEQNFLNTCTAAAINTEVLTRTPTILGLLEVGRGAVADVERRRADAPQDKLDETDRRPLLGSRMTVGDRADKRITDARAEFDAIQGEVGALVRADRPGRDTEHRLAKLTERWGRTMQKVSGVYGVAEGAGEVPVLSKKVIPGAWTASALLAAPHSVTDRVSRRLEGIDDAWGSKVIANHVDAAFTGDFPGRRTRVSDLAAQPDGMDRLWERVQRKNGILADGPSHAMHVKAIERDGERTFAVGDPMAAQLKYLSTADFARWADQKKVDLHPDDARLGGLLPKQVTAIEPLAVAPQPVAVAPAPPEPVAVAPEPLVAGPEPVVRNERIDGIQAKVRALAERPAQPSAAVSDVRARVREIENRLAVQSAGERAVGPRPANPRGMALGQ